jgi:hypothetical protein
VGFGFQGSWLRVQSSGFKFRVQGSGLRVVCFMRACVCVCVCVYPISRKACTRILTYVFLHHGNCPVLAPAVSCTEVQALGFRSVGFRV